MDLKIYEDKQEVAEQFSTYFAQKVGKSETFHVALSGGSTPKIVFDVLAQNFSDRIDWENIHFYWGDERCVPPTDEQSNYKMTVEHLFSKIELPEANIHRILGENDPTSEAMRYANLLEINLDRVAEVPQFDLVILGMGDDGHTASIFPHEIELWNSPDHCVVATHPDSGQKRVSINGKVINTAKEVAFLVTGASKAEKVKSVVEKMGGSEAYPASLVNPESGNLVWFLDKDASLLLSQ
ncbi:MULTISPECIES: 6-phosphogluconolactonase [Flavobacteriaceae]|uniref:6-phosphogluconolactonase n=1 Tax=Flavobacteriaceae TaxID=49546 RepID=UPI001491DC28|nr:MULTISPECIES: 6-phosphogluconolactonase [Allomuricauda]MDC6365044.1 6-phosphogluconolactonase [Muricauda sp. AC10]